MAVKAKHFSNNGNVSIWVKNSRVGQKTSHKQNKIIHQKSNKILGNRIHSKIYRNQNSQSFKHTFYRVLFFINELIWFVMYIAYQWPYWSSSVFYTRFRLLFLSAPKSLSNTYQNCQSLKSIPSMILTIFVFKIYCAMLSLHCSRLFSTLVLDCLLFVFQPD